MASALMAESISGLLTSIKEKDRQPYIPADIQTYANCPDTTGLNEEASNKLLFEFYHEFKRNKLKEQKKQKDKKRKEIYDKVMAGEVPEDEEALMTMFEPPEDIATYPGYPNLGNDDNFFTVSVKICQFSVKCVWWYCC